MLPPCTHPAGTHGRPRARACRRRARLHSCFCLGLLTCRPDVSQHAQVCSNQNALIACFKSQLKCNIRSIACDACTDLRYVTVHHFEARRARRRGLKRGRRAAPRQAAQPATPPLTSTNHALALPVSLSFPPPPPNAPTPIPPTPLHPTCPDYNVDETLSTLRYAARAKSVRNRPRVNEDPKVLWGRAFGWADGLLRHPASPP